MKLSLGAAIVVFRVIATVNFQNVLMARGQSSKHNNEGAEKELIQLEREAYQDTLTGNTSAVLDGVSSDFIGWDSAIWEGKVHWVAWDKNAFANDINGGKGSLANVTVDELQAMVHGTLGVVRGRAIFKRKDGGAFEMHFLDTWEKRHDRWILVAGATSTQQIH